MTEGAFEREEAMALTLLAALSGESIFLLGKPGVGKSMMARRLKIAFDGARVFEYLMSRFSIPDEIFGPVSISKLKDEDCYERVVDGYLPEAEVVFLDEIWKAGPAIQNALLTVLNEKIYLNGRKTLRLPIKGIIAASNELPAEGEGLEALWDRFLLRYIVEPIKSKGNFMKLLGCTPDDASLAVGNPVSDEEYREIRESASKVSLPDSIKEMLFELRTKLNDKSESETESDFDGQEEPGAEYYISDRRWKKSVGILRTSAYLNGRKTVDLSDTLLLGHILWNSDAEISVILDLLAEEIVKALFLDILQKYNELKRIAGKAAKDNSLYSPDGIHYVIQCNGFMLKIRQVDYEMIRQSPNDFFFASESMDERLIFRDQGQYSVRFTKQGHVSINSYSYPLLTVSGSILANDFFKSLPEQIDSRIEAFRHDIKKNLFVDSEPIQRRIWISTQAFKKRFALS